MDRLGRPEISDRGYCREFCRPPMPGGWPSRRLAGKISLSHTRFAHFLGRALLRTRSKAGLRELSMRGETTVVAQFGFASTGQGDSVNIRLISGSAQARSSLAWFAGMGG